MVNVRHQVIATRLMIALVDMYFIFGALGKVRV